MKTISEIEKGKISQILEVDSFENISDKYWYVLVFTLSWNSFENKYFDEEFKREKINSFINQTLNKKSSDSILKEVDLILKFWKSIFQDNEEILGDHENFDLIFQLENYQFNLRFKKSKEKQRSFVASGLRNFPNNSPKEKIETLIWISYRIRNNLFHGSKLLHHLKNQKEIFYSTIKFLLLFYP